MLSFDEAFLSLGNYKIRNPDTSRRSGGESYEVVLLQHTEVDGFSGEEERVDDDDVR